MKFVNSNSPVQPTQDPLLRSKLIDQIDQLLPQTQCTKCDFPRCREYAIAIVDGVADINQCPPGSDITIQALSTLTGQSVKPLNPANGIEAPRLLAVIDEANCIGCKLCIKVCPVDCIIGAGKLMHTVIAQQCTGCELCVPVCPTDCIDLIGAPVPDAASASRWPDFTVQQIETARVQTESKQTREQRKEAARKRQKFDQERMALQKEIAEVLARKRGTK